MGRRIIFIALAIIFASIMFSGELTGTVRNMTTYDGNMTIAALGADMTDLMGAPMEMVTDPDFPYDYTLEDSAIVDFSPLFVAAFMYSGPFPFPSSGNPFGVHPDPVIPMGGGASDVDIVLWADGDIGGDIEYSGSYDNVYVNVYDAFSFGSPDVESTHHIGDDSYYLPFLPAGPKKVQGFDDLNGNGQYDEGEPQGYAVMTVVGFDTPIEFILVSGTNAAEGTDITIRFEDKIDEELPGKIIESKAFPNPSYGDFSISYDASLANKTIEIFDINGRIVCQNNTNKSGITTISGLKKGTYLYKIDDKKTHGRIFILR